ncbi:hypothetical protein [Rhodoferax sp.]|uniref:hypothetical protein n=1 Tax=Rhodoferax sp. TaxID=50421 RepID=UPI003BB79D28
MSWLDKFPLPILIALAAWMAVAPISPEPHLLEKLRMLRQGALLHSAPIVLLLLRLWRKFMVRCRAPAPDHAAPDNGVLID